MRSWKLTNSCSNSNSHCKECSGNTGFLTFRACASSEGWLLVEQKVEGRKDGRERTIGTGGGKKLGRQHERNGVKEAVGWGGSSGNEQSTGSPSYISSWTSVNKVAGTGSRTPIAGQEAYRGEWEFILPFHSLIFPSLPSWIEKKH